MNATFPLARRTLTAALALLFLVPAGRADAGIWTAVDSGTTQTITAVEYEGPSGRFIYATAAGHIFYRDGTGNFAQANGPAGGIVFNDIEMRGQYGYAVGNANQVWRTKNNGKDWTRITGLTAASDGSCSNVPTAFTGDLQFVRWADDDTVYMGGEQPGMGAASFPSPVVFKSANAAADPGPPTFTDVNGSGSHCRVPDWPDDAFFLNANAGWFITRSYGRVYSTSDGLASSPSQAAADGANGYASVHNLAVDPGNPNRQWDVVAQNSGFTAFSRTEDAWATDRPFRFRNETETEPAAPYDISFAGGTVLAAGNAGEIVTSVDGVDFFFQRADGTLRTRDWRSVDLADASHGAVGGIGGSLVISDRLNTVPNLDSGPGTSGGQNPQGPASANPPPPPPPPPPTPRLSVKVQPRRDRRPPFTFRVTGKLTVPAGVVTAQGCTGSVRAVLRAGGRDVAGRSARISSRCTFRATLRARTRRALRRARSGSVSVAFPGSSALSPASARAVGVRFR